MPEKKASEKDISNSDLAAMTARGFERMQEEFNKINEEFNKVNKRLDNHGEQFVAVRRDILSIRDDFVPRHEFNDFKERFVKLEAKVNKR
jgi:hypothetical protein